MCYHFKDSDTADYVSWMIKKYDIKKYYWKGQFYINGFSHGPSMALTQEKPNEIVALEWGLIPSWIDSAEKAATHRKGTLNAKAETVFTLASFRGLIKKKKCLILADGFYEWRHINSKLKIPYLIGRRNPKHPDKFAPFTFGGIYDHWVDPNTGEVKSTFAIITTEANSMMEVIHNSKKRMPLILIEGTQQEWLTTTDPERIRALMVPFPAEQMRAYPVSKLVSAQNADRNIEEVTRPQEYAEVTFEEFA